MTVKIRLWWPGYTPTEVFESFSQEVLEMSFEVRNGSAPWRPATGTISDVKIELYRGGTLRATIATSTPNTGSYSWTVDSSLPNAKNYHIKIISINVPEIYDESDNFEITN